jgi:hypothetical protein
MVPVPTIAKRWHEETSRDVPYGYALLGGAGRIQDIRMKHNSRRC